MNDLKSVCVFCGARDGHHPSMRLAAESAGTTIANAGLDLVYGGGRVGLMGAVADAALKAGGKVIGIIPEFLAVKEIEHKTLTKIHVVSSMHERKTKMAELSDAFVALPGGAGTLEEIFEQWTWAQLGIHSKPVGFLNVDGFYDPIIEMIARMRNTGFIQTELADMVIVHNSMAAMLEGFRTYEAPQKRWT
jgi:uncharacterized protein (TIGR00730 family)